MPRVPRLDYPGAVHHVIVRGIERGAIFRTDEDRRRFLEELTRPVVGSAATLYAWALMPNHAHVLVRTGAMSLSSLAQRWLGSYAGNFNRVHGRVGYLFQSRFKSILVEEDAYLLELVRYIHLNPVRSKLPLTIESLDYYPWTGHAVLLGHRELPAQNSDFVLRRFGSTLGEARQAYLEYVRQGVGSTLDLEGGGLRRSRAAWELVTKLRRGREQWAFDERVLGGSDFVAAVLQRVDAQRLPHASEATEVVERLCQRVAERLGVSRREIASRSLRREVLAARAIVSHLAVCHHGLSLTAVGRCLAVSKQSIARAVARAVSAYTVRNLRPTDFLRN
jgi:REP-associated tyrosine transposase